MGKCLVLSAVFVMTCGVILAEQVKIKGNALYTLVESERVELPNGTVVVYESQKGYTIPETELLASEDCSGTRVMKSETSWSGAGYCVGTDTEGDMYWVWWKGTEAGGSWGYLKGTGKFEGRSGGGTSTSLKEWPGGKMAVSWVGEYEKK